MGDWHTKSDQNTHIHLLKACKNLLVYSSSYTYTNSSRFSYAFGDECLLCVFCSFCQSATLFCFFLRLGFHSINASLKAYIHMLLWCICCKVIYALRDMIHDFSLNLFYIFGRLLVSRFKKKYYKTSDN